MFLLKKAQGKIAIWSLRRGYEDNFKLGHVPTSFTSISSLVVLPFVKSKKFLDWLTDWVTTTIREESVESAKLFVNYVITLKFLHLIELE
jgi:hypothetical protein